MMNENIMTAEEVLDLYWYDGGCPVDPYEIAKKASFEIRQIQELGLSGKMELRVNQPPIIYINNQDPQTRQRFTLAHELGHYFCGHDSSPRIDPEFNLKPIVSNHEERQANDFASKLLMPKEFIDYFLIKKKIFDLVELAKNFQVSQQAMHFRLKKLGWLHE